VLARGAGVSPAPLAAATGKDAGVSHAQSPASARRARNDPSTNSFIPSPRTCNLPTAPRSTTIRAGARLARTARDANPPARNRRALHKAVPCAVPALVHEKYQAMFRFGFAAVNKLTTSPATDNKTCPDNRRGNSTAAVMASGGSAGFNRSNPTGVGAPGQHRSSSRPKRSALAHRMERVADRPGAEPRSTILLTPTKWFRDAVAGDFAGRHGLGNAALKFLHSS